MKKNMWFRMVLTVFFGLLGVFQLDAAELESFDAVPLRKCITNYYDFYKDKFGQKGDDQIVSFLAEVREGVDTQEEWRRQIGALTWTGNRLTTEPAEVKLLIAALSCNDSILSEFACDRLLWNVGNNTRQQYAESIKDALGSCPASLHEKWLIAKCGVGSLEKETLLQSMHGKNPLLRALCGDANELEVMISNFINASDYSEKERWIRPLVLVGTESCAEVLVEGLSSQVFEGIPLGYRSIRYPILQNIGLIYEERAEFFRCVSDRSGTLDELNLWVQNTFGHPAWNHGNIFIHAESREQPFFCSCTKRSEHSRSSPSDESYFNDERILSVDLGADVEMAFMPIRSGRFQMGANDTVLNEMPRHLVTINQPFWMARTVVTREQFCQLMGSNIVFKCDEANGSVLVKRGIAYEFCRKLTEREHNAGRLSKDLEYTLPSEAQWEYVCKSGLIPDAVPLVQEMNLVSEGVTLSLDALSKTNSWGICDMLGRPIEWCSDCYHETYLGAPEDGSSWGGGAAANCDGVARGCRAVKNSNCRPTRRHIMYSNLNGFAGFRPIVQPAKQSDWISVSWRQYTWGGNELPGKIYDLKKSPDDSLTNIGKSAANKSISDGKPMEEDAEDAKKAVGLFLKNWDSLRLSEYFAKQSEIYSGGLVVPEMTAAEALHAYGVQDQMAPGFWVGHYSGVIAAPENGRYRFCGFGDDVLLVRINQKLVLDASRRDQLGALSDWNSADEESGKFPLGNGKMVIGDWFSLKKGEPVEMEALIGNLVSDTFFLSLLIQREGEQYQLVEVENGTRPVLPVFKTSEYPEEIVPNLKIKEDEATIEGPLFGAKGLVVKRKVKSEL